MRWVLKRRDRLDVDYELLLGVVLVPLCAALGAGVALLPARWTPACLLRVVSGYPCPTCGTLRCIRQALAGRLWTAFLTQPLVATALVFALVYSLYSWVVVVGRLPRVRLQRVPRGFGWWVGTAVLGALAANWVYLIISGR